MFSFKKLSFFISFSFVSFLVAFPVIAAPALTILGKPVVDIILDLIDFILSIIGQVSLLILIIGGIYYIVSGSSQSEQEKARKMINYAIFGLVLVLISYVILTVIDKLLV